jgi:release factor glutamine methyltransferase
MMECLKKIINHIFLLILGAFYFMEANAQINPVAETYISKMLQKEVPYEVNMLGCTFKINNINTYPPGKLSALFASYLIDNHLIQDKTVVDAGAGCFALGIISAKQGAKSVVGIDILKEVVDCARENIENNQVENNAIILQGNGLDPLFPKYQGKVDLLLSGAPWDTLSGQEFDALPDDRKALSRAFYDIDNYLIAGVLSRGPSLLSKNGRIFISASKRMMNRVRELCALYKVQYEIVKQEDIHQDGNTHYILEIKPNI